MLVNITEHFIESGREWQVGQNPDVPREVAARWIADGKATADTDGARNQSPVSGGGATLAWRASAPPGSPLAGPINAFGVLSPLTTLLIPAGTLIAGASQIRAKVRFLRTGSAATMVPAMYVGDVNSVASNVMSDSTLATSGTVGCVDYVVDITSATTMTSWWQIDRVGNTAGNSINITTKFNVATDTYITFGVNPINAADSCALLSYDVQVFR